MVLPVVQVVHHTRAVHAAVGEGWNPAPAKQRGERPQERPLLCDVHRCLIN